MTKKFEDAVAETIKEYSEDQDLRERCILMAIDAHNKLGLEEETIRETAHMIFSYIKGGLVHDEIESAD